MVGVSQKIIKVDISGECSCHGCYVSTCVELFLVIELDEYGSPIISHSRINDKHGLIDMEVELVVSE